MNYENSGTPSRVLGFGAFLAAAFLFALGTVFIKVNMNWYGVGAVLCLFFAVVHTTVTKANLLNQLYPAFIFLVAPFINREKSRASDSVWLLLTITGAVFVAMPATGPAGLMVGGELVGDLIGIASAIISAFAICVLREARKEDNTATVIVWQFGTGVLLGFAMLPFGWTTPPCLKSWLLLFATGIAGFAGQVFLTWGYRHIKASVGALLLDAGRTQRLVSETVHQTRRFLTDAILEASELGLSLRSSIFITVYTREAPA